MSRLPAKPAKVEPRGVRSRRKAALRRPLPTSPARHQLSGAPSVCAIVTPFLCRHCRRVASLRSTGRVTRDGCRETPRGDRAGAAIRPSALSSQRTNLRPQPIQRRPVTVRRPFYRECLTDSRDITESALWQVRRQRSRCASLWQV